MNWTPIACSFVLLAGFGCSNSAQRVDASATTATTATTAVAAGLGASPGVVDEPRAEGAAASVAPMQEQLLASLQQMNNAVFVVLSVHNNPSTRDLNWGDTRARAPKLAARVLKLSLLAQGLDSKMDPGTPEEKLAALLPKVTQLAKDVSQLSGDTAQVLDGASGAPKARGK